MTRTLLLLLGTCSAYATWLLVHHQTRPARKPIPAKKAAALLQQAWADYHTRA